MFILDEVSIRSKKYDHTETTLMLRPDMWKSLGEREKWASLAKITQVFFTYLSSSTRYVTEEALLNIPAPPQHFVEVRNPAG